MPYKLVCIFFFISFAATAQSNSLIEARTLQAEGKLTAALAVIGKAVDKELSEDGGAWYTYAELNKALFQQSQAEEEKAQFLTEAIRGYQMTLKHPSDNIRINLSAGQSIDLLYQTLIQSGATLYQQQDYNAALKAFNNAIIIEPKDTTIITYAANAAVQAKRYDLAIANFQKLIDLGPKVRTYQNMISIQKDTQKDLEAALATIEKANSHFPESSVFNRYKLDILLDQEQNREAIALIAEILEKEPKNSQLALRKAVLHDQFIAEIKGITPLDSLGLQQELELAEAAYLQALESDKENVTANFNLAMLYNDQANTYYRSINTMTMDQYKADHEAYEEKALDFIKRALPLMEAASAKKPEDIGILKTLISYYNRLEMGEKKREIEKKIEALGY
ncbi:tetratricopeptide repeat protein [Roseivirga sp.]|uniref:tetratricopeptide repeat protein n=1 Tax=Roseivirga sp. TaxID=1964215 RepID=UPI003B8D2C2A